MSKSKLKERKLFFLNYGAPNSIDQFVPLGYVTKNYQNDWHMAKKKTQDCYGSQTIQTQMMIQNLKVTVYRFGPLHRALEVELLDDTNEADVSAFYRYATAASNIVQSPEEKQALKNGDTQAAKNASKKYHLLKNNCVLAVSQILTEMDPNIDVEGVTMPWVLDKRLNLYMQQSDENTLKRSHQLHRTKSDTSVSITDGKEDVETFLQHYKKQSQKEHLGFFRRHRWQTRTIGSLNDIIRHAYGKSKDHSGARTKNVLIRLKWIRLTTAGRLLPGERAPKAFEEALKDYNTQHPPALMGKPNKPRKASPSLSSRRR